MKKITVGSFQSYAMACLNLHSTQDADFHHKRKTEGLQRQWNLVTAEQELRQALEELIERHQEIHTVMACQQIEWHLYPLHGPHFGKMATRIIMGHLALVIEPNTLRGQWLSKD
ncbi:hypothetical protein OUZ56_010549 [Daphnia magna]|uniref:Uncharacterized protein n=1 Tax=Daphnia magna TaxID=35525 RepID=A0ABR0AIX3_9CRUS|nr:hypothetical protein OUZ56_010549 [Daphnia magna]